MPGKSSAVRAASDKPHRLSVFQRCFEALLGLNEILILRFSWPRH